MTPDNRSPVLSAAVLAPVLCVLSLAAVAAACRFGPFDIPLARVVEILASWAGFGQAATDDPAYVVVAEIRLARGVLAWLTGAGLAVAGAVFQGLLRNPLADPFTLGVSSGAALGASLAIFTGTAQLGAAGLTVLPFAALAGALCALFAVLGLSTLAGGLRRETLVLAGIVIATFLAALISLVKSLDEDSAAAIVFWIMGSFSGRGFGHVRLVLPFLALGLGTAFVLRRELDILSLGETQARELGVHVGRARLGLLVGASLMSAAAVAVSGVIGFVGLVVPHLMRPLVGGRHGPLMLVSALAGGSLLTLSDVAARTVLPGGAELPVGVVTALIGGPVFCVILARTARRRP